MREANMQLDALLDEAGMSRAGLAARINQAAGANRRATPRYDHTSVGRWVAGQRPRHPVPLLICAVMSPLVGRELSVEDIGMAARPDAPGSVELHQFINRAPALWRSDGQDNPAGSDSVSGPGSAAVERTRAPGVREGLGGVLT